MKDARLYLVAYDVSSPKRWRRVVKLVRRLGERRQLSVFACRMTQRRRELLERQIRRVLDPSTDRLMIVEIPKAEAEALAGDPFAPLIV